jgi:PTH1 family peptidyl-tRNA hydrolase
MMLIIGLGNPGKKFEKTRHNIGARVIDELKVLDLEKVILAKPQTFMNVSGKTVKALIKTSDLKPGNLIVIHDDMDLPMGKIRIVKNRGSAGHKGVKSIIKELGTKGFIRIRIGIQPATSDKKQKTKTEKFVLQKFTKEEEIILNGVIGKAVQAIETLIKQGAEKAMNLYNQ